jgi:signal peptidase
MEKLNWKRILKITGNVVFYAFVILVMVFAISNISVKNDGDIPNVFGKGYIAVVSDSMNGDQPDSFDKGDLIIVKVLKSAEEKKALKVGDIITFYDFDLNSLNSHRIVDIQTNTNGDLLFTTKGDKEGLGEDVVLKGFEDIKAIYVGKVTNLGGAINYLQTPAGFAIFIVLPTVAFLGYELFLFIRVLLKANSEKVEARVLEDKEKIRQELLEEIKKEQEKAKEAQK